LFVTLWGIASSLTVFEHATAEQRKLAFTKDIAPIFYQHCAACHRPNDNAPFSVLSYQEVRPWARAIREKVLTGAMPPWGADARYGAFSNDARMRPAEIAAIVAWIDQGAAEGDPKLLPPLPPAVNGWQIGQPDQVLAMLEDYVLKPDTIDRYVNYSIPTNFKEDRWIQAAEIRPGNRRFVHHVIAHVLTPQAFAAARRGGDDAAADEAARIFEKIGTLARVKADAPVIDDGAKAAHGGSAFKRRLDKQGADAFSVMLASYAPGKGPDVFPPGTAKRVPAGSVIVLQLHYSTFRARLAQPERDRTSIGLIFAKQPPAQRVISLTVPNHYFKIPPGAAQHEVTAAYTFEQDAQVLNYMPHMHLRGKTMKYEALYPDGQRVVLLSVPNFNFNWQTVYQLQKPLPLPKGTRLLVTAQFDNSAKNKYNPDPTRSVRWGDPTEDEMMIGWLDCLVANRN
jgi:hypothetical protein